MPRHRRYGINQSRTLRIPATTTTCSENLAARRSARVTLTALSKWLRRFGFSSGPPLLVLTSATPLPFASLDVDEDRRPPGEGVRGLTRSRNTSTLSARAQSKHPQNKSVETRHWQSSVIHHENSLRPQCHHCGIGGTTVLLASSQIAS